MPKTIASQNQLALRAALFSAALAVALVIGHSAQAQQESEQPAQKTKTERLLKADLDPFASDENGWTHMHWAAAANDGDAIRRLVELGAISDPVALADKSKFSPDGQRRAGPLGLQMADWVNKGQTPLHVAAELNKGIAASVLIASGANINAKDARGDTPLDNAIDGEHVAMQSLLRQHGGSDCNTALAKVSSLRSAARANNGDAVRCLVESGASVNARDSESISPLQWAAIENAPEAAAALLESGAEVDAKDDYGNTPLHSAARHNSLQAAEVLRKSGAKINAKNHENLTPLDRATRYGAAEMQSFLRRNGGLDCVNTVAKGHDLHSAAFHNNGDAARCLIENGANVNAKDSHGQTPLYVAAWKNSREIAILLLQNGADVNAEKSDGRTPLDSATNHGHTAMQSLLREHGGLACATALAKASNLFVAAKRNNTEAILCLIANGADVNEKLKEGDTPLHSAAYHNSLQAAALLLENGADVNANTTIRTNIWGRRADAFADSTPLDYSYTAGGGAKAKMRALLRRHGGRCNFRC